MKTKIFCDQSCEYLNCSEAQQDLRRSKGVRGKIPHKCKIKPGVLDWEVLRHDAAQRKELIAGKNCYKRRETNET